MPESNTEVANIAEQSAELEYLSNEIHRLKVRSLWSEVIGGLVAVVVAILAAISLLQSLDVQEQVLASELSNILAKFDDPSATPNQLEALLVDAERILSRLEDDLPPIKIGILGWGYHRVGKSADAAKYYRMAAERLDRPDLIAGAYHGLAMVQLENEELGGAVAARDSLIKGLSTINGIQEPAATAQRCKIYYYWGQQDRLILNAEELTKIQRSIKDCQGYFENPSQ